MLSRDHSFAAFCRSGAAEDDCCGAAALTPATTASGPGVTPVSSGCLLSVSRRCRALHRNPTFRGHVFGFFRPPLFLLHWSFNWLFCFAFSVAICPATTASLPFCRSVAAGDNRGRAPPLDSSHHSFGTGVTAVSSGPVAMSSPARAVHLNRTFQSHVFSGCLRRRCFFCTGATGGRGSTGSLDFSFSDDCCLATTASLPFCIGPVQPEIMGAMRRR